ncbi:MAG: 3'-5' exonuclease [Spirochaetales bacterium]|jgi:DNA polymerase-3 subunit epsilon|nr:3'-5' exonuclease [Spirochaetales bacterium]
MAKILYFDTETTGLDPKANDIIQLAMIIEIDGKVKEEVNMKMQPFDYDSVQEGALKVHGISIEEMKSFQTPQEAHKKIKKILSRHINKFDKRDKFFPAGYKVGFDLDFLSEFFKKNNDKYLGSYQNWQGLDPLPVFRLYGALGMVKVPNYKLTTMCEFLDIEIDAHDALSDIRATRILLKEVMTRLVR